MADIVQLRTTGGAIMPEDAYATAKQFVTRHFTNPAGVQTLIHHREFFYEHNGCSYEQRSHPQMRQLMWQLLSLAKRINHRAGETESGMAPVIPTMKMVNSVLDALEAVVAIPDSVDNPAWLNPNASQPSSTEIIALSNGLLHIPTRQLIPHTPQFFTLTSSDAFYNADAPSPARWLSFLDEIFVSDAEAINTLREFMGYCLTHDIKFQKIGFIHGPKRSGKGTIIRILEALLGKSSTIAMTMRSIMSDFGRQALIGRMLATFPDARFSTIKDSSGIVETLLSISGADSVNIQRKFAGDWSGQLRCKFLIASNDAPEFQDSSGALLSRFVVICTKRSFLDSEDLDLETTLRAELSGILNWALGGYDALYERMKFVQPKSSKSIIKTMEDSGSIVMAFLDRYCVLDLEAVVSRTELFELWDDWCVEIRGMRKAPGMAKLRNLLQSAVPGFDGDGPRLREGKNRTYTYKGLRLKTSKEIEDSQ